MGKKVRKVIKRNRGLDALVESKVSLLRSLEAGQAVRIYKTEASARSIVSKLSALRTGGLYSDIRVSVLKNEAFLWLKVESGRGPSDELAEE